MSRGYLFLAFGTQYINEVINLVKMIRKSGDTLPISVVCGKDDNEKIQNTNLFDKIIIENFDDSIFSDDELCKTSFEQFCLIPRLLFYKYLVYDETIITDTDMLCQYNPSNVWNIMASLNQAVVMTGKNHSPKWHFGYNEEISKNLGKNVPESHGGIFYIDKNHNDFDKFFELSIDVYKKYDEYGLKRMFRDGRVDEPVFAIVNALIDYKVLEFCEHPIITFNYGGNHEIPSKLQTICDKELENYIPFIHMFKKGNSPDYKKLFKKIMNL